MGKCRERVFGEAKKKTGKAIVFPNQNLYRTKEIDRAETTCKDPHP
jgi:hypothetical protein